MQKRLGGPDGTTGVLGAAAVVAERTGTEANIEAIAKTYADFVATHDEVGRLDDASEYTDAVNRAITTEAEVARSLDDQLQQEIDRATATLEADADDARGGFGVLTLAIPLLFVLAGALVLLGLQRRISEYR